jgi:hypothetical protein
MATDAMAAVEPAPPVRQIRYRRPLGSTPLVTAGPPRGAAFDPQAAAAAAAAAPAAHSRNRRRETGPVTDGPRNCSW